MLLARGSRVTVWVAARQVCLPEATCHLARDLPKLKTENFDQETRSHQRAPVTCLLPDPQQESHLPPAILKLKLDQESHLPPVPDFGQSYSRCSPWLRRHPETEIKTLVKKQQMN